MLLNCGAGEDSWESLGLQGDQTIIPKGNQLWMYIRRTDAESPIIWPPDVKSWLTGKDPDTGKDWRQKDKEEAEDEMVRQCPQLNEHELEQTPGNSEGQRNLACCSPWSHKDWTWLSNWTTATKLLYSNFQETEKRLLVLKFTAYFVRFSPFSSFSKVLLLRVRG